MRPLGIYINPVPYVMISYSYNCGKQNWPFFKTADFSINNAINPTNLGAK